MSPLGGRKRVAFEPCQSFLRAIGDENLGQKYGVSSLAGRGFTYLRDLGCCDDEQIQTFRDLANYSMTLQAVHSGQLSHVSLTRILDSRNNVTHRVLSLPTAEELQQSRSGNGDDVSDSKEKRGHMALYEACRLAAMIYTIMVVFPLPRAQYTRGALIHALKDALQSVKVDKSTIKGNAAMLWCLVLGGCCAEGLDLGELHEWFLDRLVELCLDCGIEEWARVEATIRDFIWLRCACSDTGKRLWTRAWLIKEEDGSL